MGFDILLAMTPVFIVLFVMSEFMSIPKIIFIGIKKVFSMIGEVIVNMIPDNHEEDTPEEQETRTDEWKILFPDFIEWTDKK